jgi:hypothetical protein
MVTERAAMYTGQSWSSEFRIIKKHEQWNAIIQAQLHKSSEKRRGNIHVAFC